MGIRDSDGGNLSSKVGQGQRKYKCFKKSSAKQTKKGAMVTGPGGHGEAVNLYCGNSEREVE